MRVRNPITLLSRARRDEWLLFGVLALSSAAALALLAARAYYGGTTGYFNLLKNLFLAWMPFWFAAALHLLHADGHSRGGAGDGAARKRGAWPGVLLTLACGALWLLFLPNAPYLLTDLIHLHPNYWMGERVIAPLASAGPRAAVPVWYDVILLVFFTWNGLLVGFVSLVMVQGVVRRRAGAAWGWAVAVGALFLSGFGISLGRFERWHSHHLFSEPADLLPDVAARLLNPMDHPRTTGATLVLSAFLMLAYLTLVALMRLGRESGGRENSPRAAGPAASPDPVGAPGNLVESPQRQTGQGPSARARQAAA